MLDAVGRLVRDGSVCCAFSDLIVGNRESDTQASGESADGDVDGDLDEDGLNPNQARAVESSENQLALIWGPPGIAGIPLHLNDVTPIVPRAPGRPPWW